MPEGDTVHRAAVRIREVLAGRIPQEILTPQARHARDRWAHKLADRALRTVDAHGKHLFLRFDGGLTIHSHLRMSGAWGVYRDAQPWKRARRRAWLILRWQEWEVVEFDGPVLELMSDARTRTDPRLASLGPDVLGERFDGELFLRRLRAADPARPIGDALLDQRTIAGIGNLWKSEACFAVGVDPWRALGQVDDDEALALAGFAREHMRESVKAGFIARPRAVYRRAGRPCERCGRPIRQRGQGENNRITFWCPGCQR